MVQEARNTLLLAPFLKMSKKLESQMNIKEAMAGANLHMEPQEIYHQNFLVIKRNQIEVVATVVVMLVEVQMVFQVL